MCRLSSGERRLAVWVAVGARVPDLPVFCFTLERPRGAGGGVALGVAGERVQDDLNQHLILLILSQLAGTLEPRSQRRQQTRRCLAYRAWRTPTPRANRCVLRRTA